MRADVVLRRRIRTLDLMCWMLAPLPFRWFIALQQITPHGSKRGFTRSMKYAAKRVRGEWFALNEDDVATICAVECANRPASLVFRSEEKKTRWRWPVVPSTGTFEDQLRDATRACGKSLNQLWEASGVTASQLSRFMRGERHLTTGAVNHLCKALGLILICVDGKPALQEGKKRKGKER